MILTRAVLENDGYESLIGVSSRDKVEKKKNGDSQNYSSEEFCCRKEQRNRTVVQEKCEIK